MSSLPVSRDPASCFSSFVQRSKRTLRQFAELQRTDADSHQPAALPSQERPACAESAGSCLRRARSRASSFSRPTRSIRARRARRNPRLPSRRAPMPAISFSPRPRRSAHGKSSPDASPERRCALPHSESLVRSSNPSLALSSRPTGATQGNDSPALSKTAYTVSRPFSSEAVVTTPRGLFIIR